MRELKGKDISDRIRNYIGKRLESWEGALPKLAIVRVGNEPDDCAYERGALKKMHQLGLEAESYVYPREITNEVFLRDIREINADPSVDGILLLSPLPKHLNEQAAAAMISPDKDIDGIGPKNKIRLYEGNSEVFAPCTAQAVLEVLDYAGIDVTGRHVTMVGYGPTVGRPLTLMLLNRKATVSVCRSRTAAVDRHRLCMNSDVVIAAAGHIGMIGADDIKDGTVVIDVGISMGDDGKIHGDVRYDEIRDIASAATPVPGGVGAVTTTILAKQLVKAAIIHRRSKNKKNQD